MARIGTVAAVPLMDICLSARLDRAIAYGESCFETVRWRAGGVDDWSEHFSRLRRGCAILGIALDEDDATRLRAAILDGTACGEEGMARVTVSPGMAPMGLMATADGAMAWIQRAPLPKRGAAHLVSMAHPRGAAETVAKFGSDYGLMLRCGGREILARGAIPLLWHGDRLCGAAIANVAFRMDGRWWTPAVAGGGVLPGVIRQKLLNQGVLREMCCDRESLEMCQSMVLLNSVVGVQPVAVVDDRNMAEDGHAAELCAALREA